LQTRKEKSSEEFEVRAGSTGETGLEARLVDIISQATDALGGSAGMIVLWDHEEKRLIEGATYGLDPTGVEQLRPLLKEAVPDLATSRQSFDLLSHLAPGVHVPATTTDRMQDPIIALPLQITGKMIGLMCVLRPLEAKPFGDRDQRVLSAFAEQAAFSVQNARLVQQLDEERCKVESILASSADGIMTIDQERRIITFNAAMERLTGWNKNATVGRYCFEVLRLRDDRGKDLCQAKCPIVRGDNGTCNLDGTIVAKNGEEVDVGMSYSLLRSSSGRLLTSVVNIRDISRLRQIDETRSRLLATITHELQTPISIIKAYASTLTRPDAEWSQQTIMDKLQAIEQESDRLGKLVSNILYISKFEAGVLSSNKLLVDLRKEASKVARRLAARTQIHEFVIDFPPGFPAVLADPEKLEEVLTNLLDNTIKFSPNGGTVTIKGEVSESEVLWSPFDEGLGIPLCDQERVFEQFYRVEDSLAKQIQGVGLGLHICRAIIEAHGGRIWVESQLRKGSRFAFTLPAT